MKAITICYGDPETASAKYRFQAYISALKAAGIDLILRYKHEIETICFWNDLKSADLIINQKCLLPRSLTDRIISLKKPVIFDFDDALWTRPGKPYSCLTQLKINHRLHNWLQRSTVITVANTILRDYVAHFNAKAQVKIIPMSLDLSVWCPSERPKNDSIRVGWAGSPGNLPHLQKLESDLINLLQRRPQTEICVYSGQEPRWSIPHQFTPFEPGTEANFVRSLDIGLLPLEDHPYSRGKSPIKAIQYIACGKPVVADMFGASQDILNPSNSTQITPNLPWSVALETLIDNEQLRRQMGAAGRKFAEEHFNLKHTALQIIELFQTAQNTYSAPPLK